MLKNTPINHQITKICLDISNIVIILFFSFGILSIPTSCFFYQFMNKNHNCNVDLKLYIFKTYLTWRIILKHQKKKRKGNWLGTCCEKLGTSVRIVEKVKMSVVKHGFGVFITSGLISREKKNIALAKKMLSLCRDPHFAIFFPIK